MKNHSNAIPQEENDNPPETNIADREFKITVRRKLNEQQENSERQFKELRNKINEQRNTLPKRLKL